MNFLFSSLTVLRVGANKYIYKAVCGDHYFSLILSNSWCVALMKYQKEMNHQYW